MQKNPALAACPYTSRSLMAFSSTVRILVPVVGFGTAHSEWPLAGSITPTRPPTADVGLVRKRITDSGLCSAADCNQQQPDIRRTDSPGRRFSPEKLRSQNWNSRSWNISPSMCVIQKGLSDHNQGRASAAHRFYLRPILTENHTPRGFCLINLDAESASLG